MAVEYIDTGNDDGVCFGRSDGKISFFAATPVVKQTGAAVATDTATLITLTTALRLALVNLGLITDV
jgi:hypothetical protein